MINNSEKKTIDICFICSSFPPDKDGVGDYTHNLVERLAQDKQIYLSLISSHNTDMIFLKDNTDFYIVPKWSIKNIFLILKYIKQILPSIIHLQYPCKEYKRYIMINILPLLCRFFFKKIIFITTIHEFSAYGPIGKFRTYLLALFSHRCIVVEKQAITVISQFCPLLKKYIVNKTHYIPIAANIYPNTSTTQTVTDFNPVGLNLSIGYFGFVRPDKGLEYLIEAFDILINRYNFNKIRLHLLCELDPKDAYQNLILNYIDRYNLSPHIRISGYLTEQELLLRLSEMTMCVFPFINGFTEKRGSVFAAMSVKKPVITTASPFIPEGLSQNENICLISHANSKLLADAILQLLENENSRMRIAQEGHVWLTMNRSWNIIAEKHILLYRNLPGYKST